MYNNGRTDAQNNGLTHDPKSVNPEKNYGQSLHKFNNSYLHATSERYADVSPFMVMDVLPRDVIPFASKHNIRSYTLSSPIEDTINKRKFYTLVPMRAILPDTWKLFYVNPTKGDDVPEDAYCSIPLIRSWFNMFQLALDESSDTKLRFIIATELIFSIGSLASKLKCNLWPLFYKSDELNLDNVLDLFYDSLLDKIILVVEPVPGQFLSFTSDGLNGTQKMNKHDMLDIMRSGNYQLGFKDGQSEAASSMISQFLSVVIPSVMTFDADSSVLNLSIDISRFVAYQISCMSQVSDSSIDYIFNSQLYRDFLFPGDGSSFDYNGQLVLYDVFSRYYFNNYWFHYISYFVEKIPYLFNYNKSLKFGDYFTTARPQVLAVGDINVDPNSDGSINSLETARKLVYTRFLNWNNRVGPKYEDYIKELTGMSAMPDPTEPAFVGMSASVVTGYEVENTGEGQRDENSITTIINTSRSGNEFDIIVSEPSILLGLTCYDVARLYTRGIDKSFFKEDRFDFFNHMLQYTGDQEINALELDVAIGDRPIAYTTKDMHYKQQVSHASGAFLGPLKHFAYTTENDSLSLLTVGINPLFIRNFNGVFDNFYSSLTGLSLGNYFHFYCRYYNDFSNMERAMDVAPDIL